jgi:hypothetical protein
MQIEKRRRKRGRVQSIREGEPERGRASDPVLLRRKQANACFLLISSAAVCQNRWAAEVDPRPLLFLFCS